MQCQTLRMLSTSICIKVATSHLHCRAFDRAAGGDKMELQPQTYLFECGDVLDKDTGPERVLTPVDRSRAVWQAAVASAIADAMPQSPEPQPESEPVTADKQPLSEADVVICGLSGSEAGAPQSESFSALAVAASSEGLGPATPLARSQSLGQVNWG